VDTPSIEFLWWAECPSWERALALLRERLAAAGLDSEGIVITEVTTDEQALRLGFPGSPTIRVNGIDIQEPSTHPTGLSCRIYRRRDGRVSPLPDAEDIDAALAPLAREEFA
jgi:hypothetical protein